MQAQSVTQSDTTALVRAGTAGVGRASVCGSDWSACLSYGCDTCFGKETPPQFERAAGNRFHRLCRDELQGGINRRTYAVVDEANTGRHWQSSSPFTFVSQNLSRFRSGHDQPQRTTAGHFLAPLRLEPSLPSPAARSMLFMPQQSIDPVLVHFTRQRVRVSIEKAPSATGTS